MINFGDEDLFCLCDKSSGEIFGSCRMTPVSATAKNIILRAENVHRKWVRHIGEIGDDEVLYSIPKEIDELNK